MRSKTLQEVRRSARDKTDECSSASPGVKAMHHVEGGTSKWSDGSLVACHRSRRDRAVFGPGSRRCCGACDDAERSDRRRRSGGQGAEYPGRQTTGLAARHRASAPTQHQGDLGPLRFRVPRTGEPRRAESGPGVTGSVWVGDRHCSGCRKSKRTRSSHSSISGPAGTPSSSASMPPGSSPGLLFKPATASGAQFVVAGRQAVGHDCSRSEPPGRQGGLRRDL